MSRYVLTPAAELDLGEIEAYLSQQSQDSTSRVLTQLHTAMLRLAEMPGLGHLRQDLAGEALRFWTVYSYLIVYRPDTKPLQIIRVLHGARDVKAILDRQ
ncbi:MAG: type II toxin-antitoxin system RelE/ParE family toxin [Phycisphaerae bacterium]|nr:type II toxin-antitoxin system RelE/ParE family toxin [Phycisphaerae bacterium]